MISRSYPLLFVQICDTFVKVLTRIKNKQFYDLFLKWFHQLISLIAFNFLAVNGLFSIPYILKSFKFIQL